MPSKELESIKEESHEHSVAEQTVKDEITVDELIRKENQKVESPNLLKIHFSQQKENPFNPDFVAETSMDAMWK